MTSGIRQLPSDLAELADRQGYPFLFLTLSGAHLYGFSSPDSDFDVRGVHVLPAGEVVGLEIGPETLSITERTEASEVDFVSHDVRKFFQLLLKRNGYVLEQLYSPLVIRSSPGHEELKAIARGCITRHHAHHYLCFAKNEWRLFRKEALPRVKPVLYIFRVLLTGIRLMRTGEVEANLVALNEEFKLPYLADLIALKTQGAEAAHFGDHDLGFIEREYERLRGELEVAFEACSLPDEPSARGALNDLLIRMRLGTIA